MSEPVFSALTNFFDDIPEIVRNELCLLLVTLSEDELIERDTDVDYLRSAHILFDAQTRIGRIGNLINAVGVFDVYFALDAAKRFEPSSRISDKKIGKIPEQHAGHLEVIESAGRLWQQLRDTLLSASAIAAALVPPSPEPASYRHSRTSFGARSDTDHQANSVRPT